MPTEYSMVTDSYVASDDLLSEKNEHTVGRGGCDLILDNYL